MSGKYMKIKRVILPTITMVIIASQLFGCASTTKQEAYDMMRETEQIELEYAVPDYDSNAEESKVELLPWLQLSSLETHPELRTAFEEYVGVTGTTGNKELCNFWLLCKYRCNDKVWRDSNRELYRHRCR